MTRSLCHRFLNKDGEIELQRLKEENEELKKIVDELKQRLANYETTEELPATNDNQSASGVDNEGKEE